MKSMVYNIYPLSCLVLSLFFLFSLSLIYIYGCDCVYLIKTSLHSFSKSKFTFCCICQSSGTYDWNKLSQIIPATLVHDTGQMGVPLYFVDLSSHYPLTLNFPPKVTLQGLQSICSRFILLRVQHSLSAFSVLDPIDDIWGGCDPQWWGSQTMMGSLSTSHFRQTASGILFIWFISPTN